MSTQYESILSERYASKTMVALFSPETKYGLWRELWVALAEEEQKLGLPITSEQIAEMKANISPIPFNRVHEIERELRHDVMAHIHAWGEQCPLAAPIIHLGATSCYVTDNGDLLQQLRGLDILIKKLDKVCDTLSAFCRQHRALPCVGYTHFQPAQPTTVGKRAALWLQDLLTDLEQLRSVREKLKFLGVKGATGTQASFLALFHGDHEKVKLLDRGVGAAMGFSTLFPVTGQTYPRKQDVIVCDAIAGIGASTHKIASDLRLLAHMGEVFEPFGKHQVGSSAMPHKRNPMLSERICALARHLITLSMNPKYTAALQWMERTLDDSANRRLTLPDLFLTADAILDLCQEVFGGLEVNLEQIESNLADALPKLAMEPLLMLAAEKGADRQETHELLRNHVHGRHGAATADLIDRIAADPSLPFAKGELEPYLDPRRMIGRAAEQVDALLNP